MDFGCVVDFWEGLLVWLVVLVGGFGWVWGWRWRWRWRERESLPLGTERRPRNLIMGVCLERIWVARIFAVAYVCLCDLWCVELRKWFVLVKKCGCAREDLVFWR